MLKTQELARIEAIDRKLAVARKRARRIAETWARVNRERLEIDQLMRALGAEREALAQGQLMFPTPQTLAKRSA